MSTRTARAGGGAVLPPFAYYGGKTRLAERIVALLPTHEHYVEPFAGSLAVLLTKPPARMETANDLDGDLVHFWRMLRDRPDELIRACALTPHARAEHAASYHRDGSGSGDSGGCDDIERARRVWSCISQGRSGVMRRTGWRHYIDPAGSKTSMPDYLAGYVDRMATVAARLANVSLECQPALRLISDYGKHRHVLLYVDPPYLGTTRCRGNDYRHEMRDDTQHRALADALNACHAAVVLSGYPSPLYSRLYAGWHRVELPAISTAAARSNHRRTEVLWSNRPLVAQTALWTSEATA